MKASACVAKGLWFVESVCALALLFPPIRSVTAQETSPPVPLGNGKIAFLSLRDGTGEIYLMNGNGSNPTRITHSPVGFPPIVNMPALSPDGTKIAFTRYSQIDNTGYDIYVVDSDGSNERRLTNNPDNDNNPDWSPDGTKIAFSRIGENGDREIYVMNADGSNPTDLTNSPKNDSNPAWSPDGSKIAFDSYRAGHQYIYVMDADGSNQIQLTAMFAGDFDPTWSPDGTKIAFTTWRWPGGGPEIEVMNADGSNQTRLTYSPSGDGAYSPSWSPDGGKIAFYSGPQSEIYVMDPDGSNRINLTNNSAGDLAPNWQKRQTDIVIPAPSASPNPHGSR